MIGSLPHLSAKWQVIHRTDNISIIIRYTPITTPARVSRTRSFTHGVVGSVAFHVSVRLDTEALTTGGVVSRAIVTGASFLRPALPARAGAPTPGVSSPGAGAPGDQ